MRKFVPPQQPVPPAPRGIQYETAGRGRSRGRGGPAFAIGLGLSLANFAGLMGLAVLKMDDTRRLVDLARGLPSSELYTLSFWAYVLVLPLMTMAALFPVLACVLGLCRQSARGTVIAYVAIQVTLIVVHWASATYLVRYGQFTYFTNGAQRLFQVAGGVLDRMPMTHLMFSLPLLALPALFIPAVRRAFSSGPSSK